MKQTFTAKKTVQIKNVEDIRSLYQGLKEARAVKNWGEFAKMIEYDRTYVSRVVNGHEALTNEFINKINDTFGNQTKNVPLTGEVHLLMPEKEFQQMMLEEIRQLKATANVVKLTAAKIAAKVNSSGIEEEYQTLLKLIDGEADRLLELDKKKWGQNQPLSS